MKPNNQGYYAGSMIFDGAHTIPKRPIVSTDAKQQRAFIMLLRRIERIHCDQHIVIEGAEITRSIGGGFKVRMNGETLKKNGKTKDSFECVALFIWQRLRAKDEAA